MIWGARTKWGPRHKWGYRRSIIDDGSGGISPGDLQAIIGGYPVWNAGLPFARERIGCFEVWAVNPLTFLDETLIENVADDSSCQVTLGTEFQEKRSLSLSIYDPAGLYSPGGANRPLIDRGSYIRVRVENTNPDLGLSHTHSLGLYRVVRPPGLEDSDQGKVVTVVADDWLSKPLSNFFQQGYGPVTQAILLEETLIDGGMSLQGLEEGTYATTALAIYYYLTGSSPTTTMVVVDSPDEMRGQDHPTFADMISSHFDLATNPLGRGMRWREFLQWIAGVTCPFTAVYDGFGVVHLRPAQKRHRSAGYTISCNPAVGGLVSLPVEALTRSPSDPAASSVSITLVTTTPVGEPGGTQQQVTTLTLLAYVASNHHNFPVDDLSDHEPIIWESNVMVSGGPEDYIAFAEFILNGYLAEADQVALAIDGAFPAPLCGEEIRICAPDDDINGWYKLSSYTITFNESASSWQMRWSADE